MNGRVHSPRLKQLLLAITLGVVSVVVARPAAAQTVQTIISGNGPVGNADPVIESSTNGGTSWQQARIISPHPDWSSVAGTKHVYCGATYADPCGLGSDTAPKITLFRTMFTLPANALSPSLMVQVLADNGAQVLLNGNPIGQQPCFGVASYPNCPGPNFSGFPTSFSTSNFFQPGPNVLTVKLYDHGGVAGVSFKATVKYSQQAPPTFSLPFNTPAGGCICTPLLMNANTAAKQSWWVKAKGGPLTITAIAHAVNNIDPERVEARVYDAANLEIDTDPISPGVNPLVAQYAAFPANGSEAADAVTLAAAPGALYRIDVTTPPPTVGTQPHFRLKFENAEAAGTGSPSAPSFEHASTKWYFNVGAGENLDLQLLAANPPDPSVTLSYDLFDPSGALHSSSVVSATSLTPGAIAVPGAAAGTWALHTDPHAHHRLSKASGRDRGIYLGWDSAGEGTLQAVASDGNTGNPNFTSGPLEFVVYDASNMEVARRTTLTGVENFLVPDPNNPSTLRPMTFPAGVYTVRITAPPGFTANPQVRTVTILCDKPAVAGFVVADLTPPVINPLANQTLEATGPGGASAIWVATANDLGRGVVPVTCTPLPGTTFPVGTTTVRCTAVDAAGNNAVPVTFTVTVVDTTAPVGACTPSVNPSGKNVPQASRQNEDGFYRVSSSDIVTASPTITIGSYALAQGETVKFTQSPGQNGVTYLNTMGPEKIRHFLVGPGDPVLTIKDAAGNTSTRTCYVPPIPK